MALLAGSGLASANPLDQARGLAARGQVERAIATLQPLLDANQPEQERARALVMVGSLFLRQNQPEAARQHLEKSLVLKSNLSAYAFYLLGEAYFRLNRHRDSRAALERVGYFNPPAELKYRVRLLLADVASAQRNFAEADRHLQYLEKRWRRSPELPEVLWRRLTAALSRQDRATTCRLARKLYARFPSHPLLYDWSLDLQNVVVQGQRLGCMASGNDQSARIRRLQLAGASDRARREMEQLRASGRPADVERADMMLVQFLTSDGYPDEALKILAKYYDSHRNDVNFLVSLAKAAARGGEFQTAVGLYQRVHELAPTRRVGRESLFQAAFLSYQFQDYDGAMRRFDRFIDLYANSGLAKDARWNLAWIRYLRGDYESAYKQLLALQTQRRERRGRPAARDDRATYWMAMSLAKMNRSEEAEALFSTLEKPDPLSFYGLAARARKDRLPRPESQQTLPLRELAMETSAQAPVAAALENGEAPSTTETEDTMALIQEQAVVPGTEDEEPGSASELDEDVAVDRDEDEKIEVSDFKDPRHRRRFEIAADLMAIGLTDWARHELYEVERRTRNVTYLRNLVRTYEGMGSFHRSVSIADTFFVGERLQGGLSGARTAWETAFPRAYRGDVERFANQFSLAPELIWSIMRAESHFKPDVTSPVGAKGLLQLMPETARQVSRILGSEGEFRVAELINPETNIRLGSRYLLRLSGKFKASLPLVAAAYNAGPHRVESWLANFGHLDMDEFIEHIPFLETRNYVKKVTRNFAVYRSLYAAERRSLDWLAAAVPIQMSGRPSTREIWE